jgi:hypothetical protein
VKRRISADGGRSPRWRRDGKELFYLAANGHLIAVPVEGNATSWRTGVPEALFQTGISLLAGEGVGSFDVSSNGRRFLIAVADDQDLSASIIVVSNWPTLLKR